MKCAFAMALFVLISGFSFQAKAEDDAGYLPEHETLYKSLNAPEELFQTGANSIRYRKQVGRLTCIQVIAKADSVVVGYTCSLQDYDSDAYLPADEKLYQALQVEESVYGTGENSVRMKKEAGKLVCMKVSARADNVVVGYECRM